MKFREMLFGSPPKQGSTYKKNQISSIDLTTETTTSTTQSVQPFTTTATNSGSCSSCTQWSAWSSCNRNCGTDYLTQISTRNCSIEDIVQGCSLQQKISCSLICSIKDCTFQEYGVCLRESA